MRRTKLNRHAALCVVGVLCLVAPAPAPAQKAAAKQTAADEASYLQQAALLSLDAVVGELREVEDYPTRLAMTGDVVRLLAKRNPGRCRELLDALFEDVLRARKAQEGLTAAAGRRQNFDAVVRAVVKVAAGFDAGLAGAYAERFAEIKSQEAAPSATQGQLPPAVADLYLRLATTLVEDDPSAAAAMARKALVNPVGAQTLVFLETLRQRDAAAAGEFLALATQGVAAREGRDVNELFLLDSYVFLPAKILSLVEGRLVLRQVPEYQRLAVERPLDAKAAGRFLSAAAQILNNPNRYAGGTASLSAGAAGDLYFIEVAEPQMRAYAPALLETLLARRGHLLNALEPAQARTLQETADRWHKSQGEAARTDAAGALEGSLERAEGLSDPDQRDRALYAAAVAAVKLKKYDLALSAAEKMTAQTRTAAGQFIAYGIAEHRIRDGALEEGEQWARKGDDLVRRAYLLTLVAHTLSRGEAQRAGRAAELLNEVALLASKIESEPERVAVLCGAAVVYARFDQGKAWELLGAAVKSANRVSGFDGRTTVTRNLQVGDFAFADELYPNEFSFMTLVGALGRNSFQQTLQEVQGLKERLPRLKAIITASGAVLTPGPRA